MALFGCKVALRERGTSFATSCSAVIRTRKVIDVRPGDVDQAIQKWEKLGYDLHDRRDFETPRNSGSRRCQMPVEHVVLTSSRLS